MKYNIAVKDKKFKIEVKEVADGTAQVTVDGEPYQVMIENYAEVVPTSAAAPRTAAAPKPVAAVAPVPDAAPKTVTPPAISGGETVITAPIPGLMIDIKVKVGDSVQAGETVATMEAMKMENNIVTNVAGTVKEIPIQKGAEVKTGDVIMVIG